MSIDYEKDDLLSIADATRNIPGHPSPRTVRSWINPGIRGVRLETILLGGRRWTSKQALKEFVDQVTRAGAVESRKAAKQ